MGKFIKKIAPKEKKILSKEKLKTNIKINLDKISGDEYKMYSSSSKIIVKNFSFKISGNTAKMNKKTYYSDNNTFNFEFKKRCADLILECCDSTNPYEMRERIQTVNKSKPKIPIAAKVESETTKSLTVLINEGWEKCKREYKASGISVEIGGLIMAKMSTYSPWPARLTGFASNKKRAHVYFFGDGTTGHVNTSEITPFGHSMNVIRLLLLRKVSNFHKGIAEVEAVMKTPPELSLLKEIQSVQNS